MRKSALHVARTEPAPDAEVDTHGPRREYVTEDENGTVLVRGQFTQMLFRD